MDELLLKYQLLEPVRKQELLDFLDFLLHKQRKQSYDLSGYKKSLLQVSTWSKEDVTEIEEGWKKYGQWQAPEW